MQEHVIYHSDQFGLRAGSEIKQGLEYLSRNLFRETLFSSEFEKFGNKIFFGLIISSSILSLGSIVNTIIKKKYKNSVMN